MARSRIVLNRKNIRKLLRSQAVLSDMLRRAEAIAQRAGDGMVATAMVGTGRARASVITATTKAREAEARNRALTRAIDAGRK